MRSKSNVVKDEDCDGNSNNRSFQLQKPYQKAEKPIIRILTSFFMPYPSEELDNRILLYAAQYNKRQINKNIET